MYQNVKMYLMTQAEIYAVIHRHSDDNVTEEDPFWSSGLGFYISKVPDRHQHHTVALQPQF